MEKHSELEENGQDIRIYADSDSSLKDIREKIKSALISSLKLDYLILHRVGIDENEYRSYYHLKKSIENLGLKEYFIKIQDIISPVSSHLQNYDHDNLTNKKIKVHTCPICDYFFENDATPVTVEVVENKDSSEDYPR
jgi:predicted secreted protein